MAHPRHKREPNARTKPTARPKPRASLIVGPLAVLATASTVSLGVFTGSPAVSNLVADAPAETDQLVGGRVSTPLSRSQSRQASTQAAGQDEDGLMSKQAVRKAIKNADTHRWTTTELNLWTEPGKQSEMIGELEAGKKVLVTGRAAEGRVEIVRNGKSRWVTEGYLSEEEPPSLGGDCTNGTSVPSGVSSNIRAVHQAVCAAFPSVSSYGTLRGGGGDHGAGRAIDIMVSGPLGWQIANFVREHYDVLGVSYVIYSQQIWSVERGGDGWRGMSDRGSATANHYDHVHVSTF